MIRLKARRNLLQAREAAQEQPRADQEQHRQGNFRSDQNATKAVMSGTGRRTPGTLVQGFAKIEFYGAQSRYQTEKKSSEQRHSKREQQNRAVQFNGDNLRDAAGGDSEQRPKGSPGQENPQRASAERKKNALRQQLPNHPHAARAPCRSNGHLPAAGCRSRQQ